MTVILPDPLPNEAAYRSELARLEQEIAAAEKHLGRLRRERGGRALQLQQLICPTPPEPESWSQRARRKLRQLLTGDA